MVVSCNFDVLFNLLCWLYYVSISDSYKQDESLLRRISTRRISSRIRGEMFLSANSPTNSRRNFSLDEFSNEFAGRIVFAGNFKKLINFVANPA